MGRADLIRSRRQTITARQALMRLAAVVALCLAWVMPAQGHDIPGDTQLHAFVKADGNRLHVLLRVPLALLMNVDLPRQGPGYLALAHVDEGLARAVAATDREIHWFENGRRLTLAGSRSRISMPSDTSFGSFDSARALLQGPPLPQTTSVFWNQGYFDAHLEFPIESADSVFALEFRVAPGLRDRIRLDLRYTLPGGVERVLDLGSSPDRVVLDPRWYQAAWIFAQSGFHHILDGPDHLLFLLCLVLPFRRLDIYLVGVVTAFTVAHSVTLISAAYGLAPAGPWFTPFIETVIAASILYMAIENVLQPHLRRRWVASALFGLVHGFGFSFMLQAQLQFAGSSLLMSLLAFNVGVEVGQLLVLVVVMAGLNALRSIKPQADRAIGIVICALAAHVAWHWMIERGEELRSVVDGEPGLPLWWVLFAVGLLVMYGWWSRRGRAVPLSGAEAARSATPRATRL